MVSAMKTPGQEFPDSGFFFQRWKKSHSVLVDNFICNLMNISVYFFIFFFNYYMNSYIMNRNLGKRRRNRSQLSIIRLKSSRRRKKYQRMNKF